MSCRIRHGLLSLVVLSAASVAIAAEPAAAAKKNGEAAKAAPATQTVKKSPLKITVELDSVLEGAATYPIAIRTKEWTALSVLSAAEHGATVKKGEVILKLDTEKIDRTIADMQADLKIADLGLKQLNSQLVAVEKTLPMDIEASKRMARIAEEDKTYFFDVERPFLVKANDFGLKMAEEMLEYQQEELRQLEKMYKADDITEETEAIVLKRGRDQVEKAKFLVEMSKLNHAHEVKFDLPRRDEQIKEATERRKIDAERNKIVAPLALQKLRLEVEKQKTQRALADEKLQRLVADRKLMVVEAPADGVVYYGKLTRGRLGDSNALTEIVANQSAVPANQVVMTIIQTRPMYLRATVSEGQLRDLRTGLKGTATPTSSPDSKLPVSLESLGNVPISAGSFDARFSVVLDGADALLMPGMTCKIKLVPYLNQNAVTVPPKAILSDDLDESKQSVQVLDKDGKTSERSVIVGRKTDKQVEILKGLSEGEQVVLEPKKD